MQTPIPILLTERLRLRPFAIEDAPAVRVLAGAAEVADMLLYVPHPYPEGFAERWIGAQRTAAERGDQKAWAITRRSDMTLVGSITLNLVPAHGRASLGYWVGVEFWRQGFATEAARRVIAFGFDQMHLHRIQAIVFPRNPASARVLMKAGLRHEGTLRGYFRKGETFEDTEMYAVLRTDRVE